MYEALLNDIYEVMSSVAWTTFSIEVVPVDYNGKLSKPNEYCRLSVLPSEGKQEAFGNSTSLSGLIAVKIFVKAGEGQGRIMAVSDSLDTVFKNKKLTNGTWLGTSHLSMEGIDNDNPTLYSASYFINFTHYGEQ